MHTADPFARLMVSTASEPVLLLRGCDGLLVKAKRATAMHSVVLRTNIELEGDSPSQTPVLVPGATSATLAEALRLADSFCDWFGPGEKV